jgi:hypothetical protein
MFAFMILLLNAFADVFTNTIGKMMVGVLFDNTGKCLQLLEYGFNLHLPQSTLKHTLKAST